jgi:hypothetical protein
MKSPTSVQRIFTEIIYASTARNTPLKPQQDQYKPRGMRIGVLICLAIGIISVLPQAIDQGE